MYRNGLLSNSDYFAIEIILLKCITSKKMKKKRNGFLMIYIIIIYIGYDADAQGKSANVNKLLTIVFILQFTTSIIGSISTTVVHVH